MSVGVSGTFHMADEETAIPGGGKSAKITRGALQVVGGAIPYIGGFLSAVAGVWSEKEQDKVNRFFEHWVQMIHDELREKEKTVGRDARPGADFQNRASRDPATNSDSRNQS